MKEEDVKVKILSVDEVLKSYPSHAHYNIAENTISIPDRDTLFKLVFAHEYIHYLRRNKVTTRILASLDLMFLLLMSCLAMSIIYNFMTYVSVLVLTVILFCYFYEEIYVMKRNLKKVMENAEKMLSEKEL